MSKGGNHKRLAAMEHRVDRRINDFGERIVSVNRSLIEALRVVGQLGDHVRTLERRVRALEVGHVSDPEPKSRIVGDYTRHEVIEGSAMACGGGRRCQLPDGMTDVAYTPRSAAGPVRCPACAERLGWIEPADDRKE